MFITNMRILQEGVSWTVPLPKGTLPAECWQANSIEPHNMNGKIMKNRKWNNKSKGFTLVEVIVVLVILAILAAILIPAMTGWIKKANEKTAIAEARSVLLSAQMMITEQCANPTGSLGTNLSGSDGFYIMDSIKSEAEIKEILEMAEVESGKISDNPGIVVENWKIKQFAYVTDSAEVVYNAGAGFTIKSE